MQSRKFLDCGRSRIPADADDHVDAADGAARPSLSPEWQTVCQDCGTDSCETVRIQPLRQALGALPMAEPAVYWLYANPDGTWCVRHEGDVAERCFAKLELAKEFIEMAVVRCSAYPLFLPRSDGSMVRQYFNWPSRAARQQTTA